MNVKLVGYKSFGYKNRSYVSGVVYPITDEDLHTELMGMTVDGGAKVFEDGPSPNDDANSEIPPVKPVLAPDAHTKKLVIGKKHLAASSAHDAQEPTVTI